MAATMRRVDYFYASTHDRPGEGYRLLHDLAQEEVNLLAVSAVPTGPNQTQFTLFPENAEALSFAAEKHAIPLVGPHRAFLLQGDDVLGAFAEIHEQLFASKVNVYAASGITDGRGGFGYLLYVRPEEFERAAEVLGI